MAATSCRDCHVGLCPPRNDTERYDNKILCHCEAEQGSAVAISPLKKEQKKAKICALILSIIFLFTALVGGSVFLIVKHINKINASTTTTTSLSNLYNTNGNINPAAVGAFLDAVGYLDNPSDTGTYTAHNIASRGTSGSDNTIIFPMGYYVDATGSMDTSKPILWQATYLWNGYLTVWMNTNYVVEYYNNSGTEKTGFGNGTKYDPYDNYSKSTLRDVTNNIYSKLNGKLESFSAIIKSPSSADATWQKTQPEDVHTYSSSRYDHHNGLYSYGGVYTSWNNSNWNTSNPPYNDNFWIPSSVEVFNQTPRTTSTTAQVNNGLWGLTAADRGFNTTTIEGSGTTSYCWLRSGYSYIYDRCNAMLVDSSGSASSNCVNYSYGVRPAAHISLNALANQVTASAGSNCSVDKTSQIYNSFSNLPLTFTYTANTNYYINSLTIDGTTATITNSTSEPSSYTILTNTQYKAYRSAYGVVTVILYNVSADISISATATGNITLTNSNTSKITNATYTRTTYDTTTATITATYASGYYPQFKYNSNEYIKISASGGSGGIGAVAYDYTFTSNVLTLSFSNLPTGIANIPTITLNTHALGENKITVNAQNAIYDIVYESTQTIVNVTPTSGYYVTQAYVDSNSAEEINLYNGTLLHTGNAFAISYFTNADSNGVMFILYRLSGNLTLNIVTGNTKPDLKEAGGAGVDVVAVYASNGGEARVTGTDFADDSDTIVCMAVAYAGYEFVNWTDSDGNNLGTALSIRLTKEQAQGKVITANFAKASNNVNTETNNTNELT